jgi:ribose 1,5-bisphosphate isomerase
MERIMSKHQAIETVVERIRTDVIGGAADTAKEVVQAMAVIVADSQAQSAETLALEVEAAVVEIMRVMPSLAPPINALHRVLGSMEDALAEQPTAAELKEVLLKATVDFLSWAESALEKVAQYGAQKIKDGDVVFTYSMSSTVWRIFQRAKSQGKSFSVVVTESRPANEGIWTVDEMLKEDIPVSVSIDVCIGELVPKSDSVFVGVDAVSAHGYSLCKVGTYPTALVAKEHGVPFYAAADTLKFDPTTLIGLPWKVEEIHRHEVLEGEYPDSVKVIGSLFDETPPALVTAIITEVGILNPTACVTVMWQMKLSEKLNEMLLPWSRGEL